MSCHLTGNSCHVYGRSYIRNCIGCDPQYPFKKRIDIDNQISPIDITILMKFSQFYKQRILPEEVYQFFVLNDSDTTRVDFKSQIDFSKILEQTIVAVKHTTEKEKPKRTIQFAGLDDDKSSNDNELIETISMKKDKTNPLIKLYQDYLVNFMRNIQPKKKVDPEESKRKNAVTAEELRRDLFQRRKRRQKYRDFNSVIEEDKKAVEKIMNSKLPIDRSMLLKEQQKFLFRKQTKLSTKMSEMGIPPLGMESTFTDMGGNTLENINATANKTQNLKLQMMQRKQLKFYDLPVGAMTDFQREIVFTRILEKVPQATLEGEWRD